jgi:hypothetical protein
VEKSTSFFYEVGYNFSGIMEYGNVGMMGNCQLLLPTATVPLARRLVRRSHRVGGSLSEAGYWYVSWINEASGIYESGSP